MSAEFLGLRETLTGLVREESIKAMGGEISADAMRGLSFELHGQRLDQVI